MVNGINIGREKKGTMIKKEDLGMIQKEIDRLRKKLEKQVKEKDSYHNIYETSVKIDELIVDYYHSQTLAKNI